jgi:membrane protease YdiL (CAAX protease family)
MSTAPNAEDRTGKGLIARRPLAVFFVLAYVISWLIWSPGVAAALGLLDLQLSGSLLTALGTVGPALAALIVTAVTGGADGVKDLVRRTVRWRVKWQWILLAGLGPLAAIGVGALVVRLGGAWPDLSARSVFPNLGWFATWLVFLGMALGEEPGWRGFALPRLQARHSAFLSTLILTAIWLGWHLPTYWFYPTAVEAVAQFGPVAVVLNFVILLAQALLYAWMLNSSKGSVLMVVLLHAGFNLATTGSGTEVGGIALLVFVVVAVIVVIVAKPANLARGGKQSIP